MRVRLFGDDGLAPANMRRRLERRLRLVVGRRAPSISSVEVYVSRARSEEPAAAAARHRCRIRARLQDGSVVHVEEEGEDVDAAVGVAAWRLDRRLDRSPR